MNILIIILILFLILWILWLNHRIEKEKKRNRIVQAFLAGVIRAISDYKSKTDEIGDEEDLPEQNYRLPIPYEKLLESIDWEFSKDFPLEYLEKWLKHDRNLFDDSQYGNDGFNFMYLDLYDKLFNQWFSKEITSQKNKEYIRDDIKITENNIGELEGEIAMLKDIKNGKLDHSSFTPENIDEKMLIMFNHIKKEKVEEVKRKILERITHDK